MPLLCVSSPKGGVGKTTLAANIAWELTRRGDRVIVVDLDPQNSLGLHFGMDLRDSAGFAANLNANDNPRAAWRAAVRTGPAGVPYLPYGQSGVDGANAISRAIADNPELLVASIRDMLTNPGLIVVADMPPGPTPVLSALVPHADLVAVVLLVDAASLAQIPAIEGGRAYGSVAPARLGFVLNQLDIRTRLGRASGDSASRHLGSRLLGVVYRDENVCEAIASQKMVGEYAPASKAAKDIRALTVTIARRLVPVEAPALQEERL
jgi:cellulose synthase operon protein YhjQ